MAEWLPLFPLQEVVLFPGAAIPLRIFEDRYVTMVRRALEGDRRFGVVLIRSGEEAGEPAEPVDVGCVARIEEIREAGGQYLLIASGQERFRILQTRREGALLVGLVEPVLDELEPPESLTDLTVQVVQRARAYFELVGRATGGMFVGAQFPTDPTSLSHLVAFSVQVPAAQRQALLELTSTRARLERLQQLLASETTALSERLREREAALKIAVTNGKPPPGYFDPPAGAQD
ncbi:MAG: LON peptidase substrate-binding domain-containing protein [Rubrivivax sp.]|nr:LON peptidase substrate-binding domain-containing protein [Rubrivivax sp.]